MVLKMAGVAILGYGVVGAGTARLLTTGRQRVLRQTGLDLELRRIVDIRKFPGDPLESCLTADFSDVLADPDIRVVVETIGGIGIAYEFTKKALSSGRHVVTSNKELVATFGPELMDLASDHGVRYLFEASVGGGIPIIHPMRVCLVANEIRSVSGILNGTTNYILTRMEQEGIPFSAALSEAQSHGFAEQKPEADIEGIDACRKLAILSSIAYGGFVRWQDIHTEGISGIDADMIAIAASAGAHVKLVARSMRAQNGRIAASVAPVALSASHPVSCASGVNNAISIDGDAVGTTLFYGPGAGAMPTASAVVSDVIECLEMDTANVRHTDARQNDARHSWPALPEGMMLPFADHPVQVLVRNSDSKQSELETHFGNNRVKRRPVGRDGRVLLFGEGGTLTEGCLSEALAKAENTDIQWIRYIG